MIYTCSISLNSYTKSENIFLLFILLRQKKDGCVIEQHCQSIIEISDILIDGQN